MPILTFNLPDTTFISSAQPDMNLSFYPLIYVGTDPSYRNCIGLINVTLPQLPVSRVDSALLQLSVIVKSGANPSTIVVNQVTNPFVAQTVTYNTRPGFTATASQIDVTASNLYTSIQIDVTELVNSWLDGSADNDGIALTNSDGVSIVQFGTNNIVYEPYFPKMVLIYSNTPTPNSVPYGRVYHTGNQQIAADASVPFGYNGPLNQITHQEDSGLVMVGQAGLYTAWFTVIGQTANQFALYQNEAVLLDSTYGTASGGNNGTATINAAAGDVVSLRNRTSSAVTLNNTAGGSGTVVSASIFLLKIGSNVTPDSALAGVNAAQNFAQMNAAITAPELGLNLAGYNALTGNQQQYVCSGLLTSRPTLGYLTVSGLQQMLNYYVALAPTYAVDPNNIQVKAGATGGNGSIAKPFSTIQERIDAVNPGGNVHIQGGVYHFTELFIRKDGINLLGESNSTLMILPDHLFGMVVVSNNVSITGLTFTQEVASFTHFLTIDGKNANITNNNFYGPSNWRDGLYVGINVSQEADDLSVSHNTFYNVSTAISINYTRSRIENNHIFASESGIQVFGGSAEIILNYWEGAPNNCDIILWDPMSYDVDYLRMMNDNANICLH